MRRLLPSPTALIGCAILVAAATQVALGAASNWSEGHNSRARLVAGNGIAGVELQLPDGWKTYWRTPGEAGGVAPSFDWSKSTNLDSAQVLYPAPKRFTDRAGDTIGYKGTVVFPVRLKPKDPAKPIDLNLAFAYGVCKDICIPSEANLSLAIAPEAAEQASEELTQAMARVPNPPETRRNGDPSLKRAVSELSGPKPRIVLETLFPGGGEHADVFVEAPEGLYVPLPKKVADDGKGSLTFEIDLSSDADIEALKNKTLTATLVSDKGQSEATFPLQ